MSDPARLLIDNLDIWSGAIEQKNSAGRGNGSKLSLYGIEKLRSLILDLAVRGKLVPQNPNDEPASALLPRIEAAAKALSEKKEIRGSTVCQPLANDLHWYAIPEKWIWLSLGSATNYGFSEKTGGSVLSPDTWVLELENVEKGSSKLLRKVRFEDKPFQSAKSRFRKGDVIYGKLRPYLDKVIVADEDGVCTTEMIPIRGHLGIDPYYLRTFLKSPQFVEYASSSVHGMNLPRLGTSRAREAPFPLPPLAEQKRIVAKVDELMALCDALEAGTREAMAAHQTLVREVLSTLVNSQDADDLATNWSRVEDHFDTLFTTEVSINALKQTILELAVTGRIVRSKPEDEPVDRLVARIDRQRKKDFEEGAARKQKNLTPFERSQFQGTVPDHWKILQLDRLVHIHSGITKGRNLRGQNTIFVPYLRVANVQRWFLDLEEVKEVEILENERQKFALNYGDILVTEGGDWDKVGRTCIWRGELEYCAHQNHVFKARKILAEQNEEWIELFLNSAIARAYFADASKQTTNLASINKTELRSCPIPLPPPEEQQRILDKYRELSKICDDLSLSVSIVEGTGVRIADSISLTTS